MSKATIATVVLRVAAHYHNEPAYLTPLTLTGHTPPRFPTPGKRRKHSKRRGKK